MKTLLAAAAAVALFSVPALAADVDANSTGGKPSSNTAPSENSAAKNEKAYDSTGGTGSSTGMSGTGANGATSEPTAPQEQQDLRQSGEAPSEHNDPGTSTSPPPDTK